MEKKRCEAEVPYKLTFYRTRQCKNNATVCVDGKSYCGIHNPENKKKRESKKAEKFESERVYKLALYISELQHRK
jgi:hypothetical protein